MKKIIRNLSIGFIAVLIMANLGLACEKTPDPIIEPEDTISLVVDDTIRPLAAFSYIAKHLEVTFTNESQDARSYTWRFNDGTYQEVVEHPVHTFPRTGLFDVLLIARSVDKINDTIIQQVEVFREEKPVNPNFTLESPYKNLDNWYRGQMHVHSTDSIDGKLVGSPDAEDPPDVMMKTYRDKGYDFVALTDHWVYTVDPEVEGVLYISGEEVEADLDGKGVHANIYNIFDTIPNGTTTEDLIAMEGSFTQLNHPTRSSVMYHHIDNSGVGLWAIEVSNWYNKKPMDLLLWDNQITKGKRVWCNAGDDMHDAGGAGHNATMVNSQSNTLEDIMANLLAGNFYATEGGPDFVHMDITTSGKTITCTTNNGSRIKWYKEDMLLVKETSGGSDSYTPTGNEVFIRVEVQMEKDDDRDGIPNTAFSQAIFLVYP